MARLLGVSLLAMALLVAPSRSSVSDDVPALLAFKSAIYDDPLSKLSDWNYEDEHPCAWSGVSCWPFNSSVMALELSNSSLTGFLAPEIGSLSSLQILKLDNNTLMGSIPREIGKLKNLTVLDLSTNQLTGPIPSEIGDMPKITKIDLHANRLNGVIPPELGKLMNLTELRLSNNSLAGIIPSSNDSNMVSTNREDQIGLCQLAQLTDIDLSYNLLTGNIPLCLQKIVRSSMVGNCFQNNDTTNHPVHQCDDSMNAGKENNFDGSEKKSLPQPLWLLIVEVITGVLLLTTVTLCAIIWLRRHKARSSRDGVPWTRAISWKENTVISIDDGLLGSVPKISRRELAEACEDFSNIIGSSHETVVYKGTMKDGCEIAVVSLSVSAHRWTSYIELYFHKEVVEMARLSHENVAKMVGYCKESDPFSRMLVFEYPPNGTLYEHLHDSEGCQLSWTRRMKIALSIARVLRYLHTELQPPFAVAALTSSSVYLTEDFSPKIIDFERWRALVPKLGLTSGCAVNGGVSFDTIMADSRHRRFMDVQANTFAFGVILLELISGRASLSRDTGDLVDWARKHLDQPQDFSNLVDPKLKNVNHENLGIICNAMNLCIDPEPPRRPSMNMISAILEEGVDTSAAAALRASSLAWAQAELAISASPISREKKRSCLEGERVLPRGREEKGKKKGNGGRRPAHDGLREGAAVADTGERLQALGTRRLAASPLLHQSSPAAAEAKRKQKKPSDDADEEYLPSDDSREDEDGESSSSSDQDDEEEEIKTSSRSRQKGKKMKLLNSGKSSKSTPRKQSAPVADFADDDAALQQAIALSLAEPSGNLVTAMGAETSSTGMNVNEGTPCKNNNTIPIQDSTKNRKTKKQVKSRIQLTEDDVVAIFFSFDEVGKGYITPWDLERMANVHDFIWTDSEIYKMIHCFDSDRDGKINLEDFRTIICRCNMLQDPGK